MRAVAFNRVFALCNLPCRSARVWILAVVRAFAGLCCHDARCLLPASARTLRAARWVPVSRTSSELWQGPVAGSVCSERGRGPNRPRRQSPPLDPSRLPWTHTSSSTCMGGWPKSG